MHQDQLSTPVEIHPIIAMHKLNKNWSTKRLTISQVIEKANLVHNHKYKYTLEEGLLKLIEWRNNNPINKY